MVRPRPLLPLALVLVALAGVARADRAAIQRIDARLRARASGAVTARQPLERKPNLTRVTYASGHELLHIRPAGDKGTPRGVLERAVHLTARHLRIPLRTAPPVVEHDATVYGKGYVMPWVPKLRNLLAGDWELSRELAETGWRHPERIDWDSVHAVVVLDFVTGQEDRSWNNVFIRERGGKLAAVALDGELTFGHSAGIGLSPASSPIGLLVRNAPAAWKKLSPRVRRGLDAIDVEAWKEDLRGAGVPAKEVDAAADRLRQVKERGFAAIFPEAVRW